MHISNLRLLLLLFFSLFLLSCKEKSLKYANGDLDNAFNEAKLSHKKLLVIAFMTGCQACENDFFKPILMNKETQEALAGEFLLYKCNINDTANSYLAKSAHNIGSPTFYLFENNLLKEVVMGAKDLKIVMRDIIVNKNSHNRNNTYRIGLEGNEYVDFTQELISISRFLKTKPTDQLAIRKALKIIEVNIAKKPFFYNYYMAWKLSLMSGNNLSAKTYLANAKQYNDAFTTYLYKCELEEIKKSSN